MTPKNERRVGLWLIGAFGGVGSTATLGLAALGRGLVDATSLVTALPLFDRLDLDPPAQFVVGGHDIRRTSYRQAIADLHQRSNVLDARVIEACLPDMDRWTEKVRPGTVLNTGTTIARLADLPEVHHAETLRAAIARIQADLQAFREAHHLDQMVVVSTASTEPPFQLGDVHTSLERLVAALEERHEPVLPASSLYAWAALDLGLPYINFTPSPGRIVLGHPTTGRAARGRLRRPRRQNRRDPAQDGLGTDVYPAQPAHPELGRP